MAQETALTVTFNLNYDVRIIKIGDEFWFVAVDVCKILDLKNPRDAVSNLDDDEKMTVDNTDGHSGKRGGAQKLNVVNESGLYHLIFQSRKPEAKKFKRWVFHDVLPQIRKSGSYFVNHSEQKPENLLEEFQPDGSFNDVAVILRMLKEKGIEYDFEFIDVTPNYNENAKQIMPTYNFKLKIKD